MSDAAVIYEVTLAVDPDALETFDPWLKDHVAEMLRLPGFVSANILTDEDGVPEDTRPSRTVQYIVENREALETYLQEHAARMRQHGIDLFGDRFTATRRVLNRVAAKWQVHSRRWRSSALDSVL